MGGPFKLADGEYSLVARVLGEGRVKAGAVLGRLTAIVLSVTAILLSRLIQVGFHF